MRTVKSICGGGDGGGSGILLESSGSDIFERMYSTIHSPQALSSSFFKVEIS